MKIPLANVNSTAFERNCLLKYITQPFVDVPSCQWHQSLWQVPILAAEVGCFGYNVDVVEWNCADFHAENRYDMVIDISPHNRELYQHCLKPGCRQILFATGSYPPWQRRSEEARLEDLCRRRGARLAPHMPEKYFYPHPDAFDALFLVGNQNTLDTFGPIKAPVFFIRNSGYPLSPLTDLSQKSPRDFLFFASGNQVLKGLDLLLEAFAAMPEINLYICSLYQKEPEFCRLYDGELFHRPNIKAVGFVDLQGDVFREMCRRCSYVILPSCSEGSSGSVLAAMSAGLIPVVSRACGLDDDAAIILEDCTVEHIKATVRRLAEAPAGWLRNRFFRSLALIGQRYSPRHYILSLHNALAGLIGPPPVSYTSAAPHLAEKRSACMIANTRVGIPLTGGKHWHGGISYVETLVRSLSVLPQAERPQLYLVVTADTLPAFDGYRPFLHLFAGVIFLGPPTCDLEATLGIAPLHLQTWDELFSLVDFYYPVNSDVLPYRQAVSWIPDFQHRYLPEFFSAAEYQSREVQFRRVAEQAGLVILNSRSAEDDFKKFYPQSPAVTRVLSAHPLASDDWYRPNPEETQRKYSLPDRFILCANQFWAHKNHLTLFQAVGILKNAGLDIHLVCTGPTTDYRAPGYFETLQNEIIALGIQDDISILGFIPREDQLQLLRRSLFVVQPSLFEGLSLVVQECRALGKPIVLSDLDVHKEYRYGSLFSRLDALDLAQKIACLLYSCRPGPDEAAEADAKAGAQKSVEACARDFCTIINEHLGCPLLPAPVESAAPPATILTSLTRDNIANQQAAVLSWRQCGFRVIALNSSEDAAVLQPFFPAVEFVSVHRDARAEFGKPFVYLDDLLGCCARQQTAVCGIVKSDIAFNNAGLAAFVAREAADSVVFGSRMDADSPACDAGTPHGGGFDYIFFAKRIVSIYPPESFCLGLCWWDYWLILMALANDIPGKRLTSPVAWHVKHPVSADVALWHRLGVLLSRYATTDYAVTTENTAEYQRLLFQIIIDNSISVLLM